MNLIDLFWLILRLGISIVLGSIAMTYHPLVAFILALCAWILFPSILHLIVNVLEYFFPPRLLPICAMGRCSFEDYKLVSVSGDRFVYRCKCGQEYVDEDASFDILEEDGSSRPYKVYVKRRGWVDPQSVEASEKS